MPSKTDIQNARRKLGLDRLPAQLGNGSGQPRTPDGLYWVQKKEAGGLSEAIKLPLAAGMSIKVGDGVPCEVGWDKDNNQVIYPVGGRSLATAGINPQTLNPLDSVIQAPVKTVDFPPFLCKRHGDTVNFPLTVVVYVPPVANADGTVILPNILQADLTSFVPTAGLRCFAVVFWLNNNTLEVKSSTPVSMLDPLTNIDLEACIAASTAGSIPVWAWILQDGQTVLSPDPALNMDMRQFINVSTTGGGSAPTTATYITQTHDATLSAEQAMGDLATGLVKNTTTTGVQSIAAAGTDYLSPTGTENFSNKTSTNQLMIDGSSDQVQQRVQAHSTQTNLLATWENSSAVVQASISGLGAAVFNEQGNDADFRVEGDTDPNVFVVDASLDNAVIGSATGSSDSKLAINSTTSGFRPPRMTTTERNAISPIGNGVIIFNTTTGMPNVYSGSWLEYVLLTTSQTVTNKTIDGSVNTISNLDGSVITTGLVGASHLTAMVGATHIASGTGGAIGSNPAAGDDIKAWLGNATFARIAHHQFSNEQSVTQSGTTSEVSLLSATGMGSPTIAANRLRPASVVRLHLEGYGRRTASATTAFRVYAAGSALLTLAATAIAWATDTRWAMDAYISCYTIGSSGTIIGGFNLIQNPTASSGVIYSANNTATTTVNTTTTIALDVTSQMNTAVANNYVVCTSALIEIIG